MAFVAERLEVTLRTPEDLRLISMKLLIPPETQASAGRDLNRAAQVQAAAYSQLQPQSMICFGPLRCQE